MVKVFHVSDGPKLKKFKEEYMNSKSYKGEQLKGKVQDMDKMRKNAVGEVVKTIQKRMTDASDDVIKATSIASFKSWPLPNDIQGL